MKTLTEKELAIMIALWENGACPMKELLNRLPEPRPHFNTLSTLVKRLEEKGFIKHRALSTRFFLYEAAITRERYEQSQRKSAIRKFFGNSYLGFVSHLVQEEEISIEELKELIKTIEEKQ